MAKRQSLPDGSPVLNPPFPLKGPDNCLGMVREDMSYHFLKSTHPNTGEVQSVLYSSPSDVIYVIHSDIIYFMQ